MSMIDGAAAGSRSDRERGVGKGGGAPLGLPKIIDLFAGCGGMSLGFERAGFELVAAYDNWDKAVDSYNANLDHPAKILDLGDFDAVVEELAPHYEAGCPAIIGGPPCQDFSSAGKRKEGRRADLTEKFAWIVARFKPPFFVMENVSRIEGALAFKVAREVFAEVGYKVDYAVLNASECGVPQNRKRLITFGSFDAAVTRAVMEKFQNGLSERRTTVRDWFGDSLDTEFYYRHPRSYARRGVYSIDEPSPTIRGVNRPVPEGYPGHPGDAAPVEKARPLTTRERASIQTFPESFVFSGSKTEIEQQIGNAVPVGLAEYIAKCVGAVVGEREASSAAAAS